MDTYREVALGVESAWPAFVYGRAEEDRGSHDAPGPKRTPGPAPMTVSVTEVTPAPIELSK